MADSHNTPTVRIKVPRTDEDTPNKPLSPIDEECIALLKSIPPPPMPPRRRPSGSTREWSNSDIFDIEVIQQEVRASVARQAAEELAKRNADILAGQKALDEEKRRWRWSVAGDVVKWAVVGILGWLGLLLWRLISLLILHGS